MKKKCHLKKLALMGITGGVILAQGTLSAEIDMNSTAYMLAANSCSSQNGCNSGTNPNNPQGGNYRYTRDPNETAWEQGCKSNPANNTPYSQGYRSYNAATSQGCNAQQNRNVNNNQNISWHGCNASQNYKNDTSWSQADKPQSPNSQGDQGYGNPDQQNQPKDQQNQPEDQQNQAPNQMNPGKYQSARTSPTRYFIADNATTTTATTTKTTTTTLTEADLLKQLNDQTKAIYNSLSPEGKALALKMANQSCKGKNSCKGLNSCKTEEHSCAGKGSCAGTAAAPFKDKNQAVKIAAQKMAEKRASLNK